MLPIILGSIHFFIFTKICVLHSRLFSALVALLACSFLFNTLLHFPDFIKMDPKYVNDVLPVISMLCSSFISCMSIHTFKYSVLRICSFKPHFLYSFNFFCRIFCINFILRCNNLVICKKMVVYCFYS